MGCLRCFKFKKGWFQGWSSFRPRQLCPSSPSVVQVVKVTVSVKVLSVQWPPAWCYQILHILEKEREKKKKKKPFERGQGQVSSAVSPSGKTICHPLRERREGGRRGGRSFRAEFLLVRKPNILLPLLLLLQEDALNGNTRSTLSSFFFATLQSGARFSREGAQLWGVPLPLFLRVSGRKLRRRFPSSIKTNKERKESTTREIPNTSDTD